VRFRLGRGACVHLGLGRFQVGLEGIEQDHGAASGFKECQGLLSSTCVRARQRDVPSRKLTRVVHFSD
jgi:hypothetical protein